MPAAQLKTAMATLRDRLAPLKNRFDALAPNEQRALQWLAAVFAFFLVYNLVIQPIYAAWQQSKTVYQRQAETWLWIEQNAPALEQLQKQPTDTQIDQALVALATETATQHGLNIASVTPEGDARLQYSMRAQPFTQVIQWVNTLEKAGVTISRIEFSEAREGVVHVRGTLDK